MSVIFDVQGIQSRTFGERGVARYLAELALALERWFPTAVERYLINPDLSVAESLQLLPPSSRVGTADDISAASRVYHAGSVFEPDVSLDGLWPPAARAMRLAVTLYDLIPELFPETYLTDPRTRRWYRTRLALVRRADRILAISRATATDAAERLGVPSDRIVVVGAAASSRFEPPRSRETALADVREAMPEVEPGFLLYTGGIEPRKNIDRLLKAYAGLAEELQQKHQLVIVCRVLPEERARLEAALDGLGVAGRVHFPGYVTDRQLVSLYGATTLFVFPSLYEGYGLPVAEAAACGAAVVASNTSSLVELVRVEAARFNPYDIESIRSTIARCLTEAPLLEQLRRPSSYALDSWHEVARRTVAVYEELAARPRRRRTRRRSRIAYVSPLPPQRSGIADYSYRLLTPLSRYCDLDAFVDASLGDHEGPPGVHVSPIRQFQVVEHLRGGYDHVLICLGNSEHHVAALDLLRRRGGTVLAHDVRLTGMYGFASLHRPELEPRPLQRILQEMYNESVPIEIGRSGVVELDEAQTHEIFMAREAIALADCFVVHSHYAAHLARHDAAPEHRHKVRVAPFAFPDPAQFSGFLPTADKLVVSTFGVVAPVKQTEKVIDAFSVVADKRGDCVLVVAGPPAAMGDYDRLNARVNELGLADRVRLLGDLDSESFRKAIAQTTVAVQLRAMSMGESPASVGDCLAAGVPTVVTAVGAARELPDQAVVKVTPDVRPDLLGHMLLALLDDAPRRASMRATAQGYARERSFEHAAQFLYEEVVLGRRRAGNLVAA
jgi:glycosyltransferase involved in cell wall biosynthesis